MSSPSPREAAERAAAEQIREQFMRAFFNKVDEDVARGDLAHVRVLLAEIVDALCGMVPGRIGSRIRAECSGEPTWELQQKLVEWIERLQAPVHDATTRRWKQDGPVQLSTFLRRYYAHLQVVSREAWEARQRIANGESAVPPEHRPAPGSSDASEVPNVMRSGQR